MRKTFEIFEIREGSVKRVTLVTCESEDMAREIAEKKFGAGLGVRELETLGMFTRTQ